MNKRPNGTVYTHVDVNIYYVVDGDTVYRYDSNRKQFDFESSEDYEIRRKTWEYTNINPKYLVTNTDMFFVVDNPDKF